MKLWRLAFAGDAFHGESAPAKSSDFYPRYQEFQDLIELIKPSGKFDLRVHLLGQPVRSARASLYTMKNDTGKLSN